MELVRLAYNDLLHNGSIRFSDFVAWADRFIVSDDQFEYVWDTLTSALNTVGKWKEKLKPKQAPTKAPKTTRGNDAT